MSKITFALTTVMLVSIVPPMEVSFARINDFKVAFNRGNDFPNSGICPGSLKRVKDLKNCPKR
jgi:hypothetical protein